MLFSHNHPEYRLVIFTDDNKDVSLYYDSPEKIREFLTQLDFIPAYTAHTRAIYLMNHTFDGKYTPVERLRYRDDEGYHKVTAYYDTERDAILSRADLEKEYIASDQKKYYDNLDQYINACMTYNNGTLETF